MVYTQSCILGGDVRSSKLALKKSLLEAVVSLYFISLITSVAPFFFLSCVYPRPAIPSLF